MSISRRSLIKAAGVAGVGLVTGKASADDDAIKVGSLLDTSGIFQLYGRPMDKAVTLAIEETNAMGGLLGRPLRKVAYDTRSDIGLYTEFAKTIAARDEVDVVHGAVLSAAREAIRPILRESQTLYFYNTQYEGGVCDRNIFCTGITPAQQTEVLVPAAIKRWGKKICVLAADYNYGHITARWIEEYARQNGGEVLSTEFFALDVADFSESIAKIQALNPDFVVSVLVGGAHLSFYRQWAATGLNQRVPLASTTMGAGNEHTALTREEGDGIMMVYSYSRQLDSGGNRAFLKRWKNRFGTIDDLHELAVATYQGVHLWAQGVRAAKSLERDKVIEALESGVRLQGPVGRVSLDAKTHHVITPVHLIEVADQKMNVVESFGERQPVDTQAVCDLEANPDDTAQYEI
jgi:branched-chain amino acid transport system substrate-binding protein